MGTERRNSSDGSASASASQSWALGVDLVVDFDADFLVLCFWVFMMISCSFSVMGLGWMNTRVPSARLRWRAGANESKTRSGRDEREVERIGAEGHARAALTHQIAQAKGRRPASRAR